MYTIKGENKTTITIEKSEFITIIKHVDKVSDAKEFIQTIKSTYPDATHVVDAYLIGKTAEYGHSSDDGEPQGTAGLPVLDVFRKNDITNFVCVVIRYFGGVKLGAGGLVRAYSKSASNCLKEMEVVEIIDYTRMRISFNYSYITLIDNYLKDVDIIEKSFQTDVKYTISLPVSNKLSIINGLISLTNNQIQIEIPKKDNDDSEEYQNDIDSFKYFDM